MPKDAIYEVEGVEEEGRGRGVNISWHSDTLKILKIIIFLIVTFLDGRHNDLPWNIRKFNGGKLQSQNLASGLQHEEPWSRSLWSHTDLLRLRQGRVGAQVSIQFFLVRCSGDLIRRNHRAILHYAMSCYVRLIRYFVKEEERKFSRHG